MARRVPVKARRSPVGAAMPGKGAVRRGKATLQRGQCKTLAALFFYCTLMTSWPDYLPSGNQKTRTHRDGHVLCRTLKKQDGVGAASQLLTAKVERSGLLMHTAMTESVSLCEQMKN